MADRLGRTQLVYLRSSSQSGHSGFDLAEHPLSLLALGDQGWIQTMSFIVCGAAFVAAALTERRTTNRLTRGPDG